MRTRVRLGAALLLAMGIPATAAGQQALSFRAAADRAMAANERVQAAAAAVERAEAERWGARGRHLPDVSVSGRRTRIDAPIAIDLAPIRGALLSLHPQVPGAAVPPFITEVQGETFTNLMLTATLPVFTGGRLLASDRAASAALESARAQQQAAEGELFTELAQRYFGYRLARSARLTRERTASTLLQHVARARALEREGQIARAERLRAEVALAEAQRELRQAERDESVAGRALAATLSLEDDVVPTTPLTTIRHLPPLDSLLASSANPQLVRLRAEVARARQGVRAAAGELAPTVALFATRELYTRDLTLLQPEWAAGVSISLPLFQGGRRIAQLSAARALERELSLRLARAERDVRLLAQRRHAELEEAGSQLTALEATRSLAEESLRAQQRAFAAGLATSLDVLDAEQALGRVELGILKAKYDADVALAGLLEAAGASARLPELMAAEAEAER